MTGLQTRRRLTGAVHALKWRLGGFLAYRRLRWESVQRLVFVCKGNICRSPYAEQRCARRRLPAISFGLAAGIGVPAEPAIRKLAKERGVDLDAHLSRPWSHYQPAAGDLILVMGPHQLRSLGPLRSDVQVTLVGIWSKPPVVDLWDPFGQSVERMSECLNLLDGSLNRIEALWANTVD